MVVLINGAFGVGKTTVAARLRAALPGAVVYDPEPAGVVLAYLRRVVPLAPAPPDDFQEIAVWRRATVAGVRAARLFARGPVLVPMAFCRRGPFDDVVSGIERFERDVRTFCLRAEAATVRARATARGDAPAVAAWIASRIGACVDAHRDAHFGEPVDTEGRTADAVAAEIARRLGASRPG